MELSSQQQEIVNLNSGQHVVLAPPGTGKTELLVQRLSNAVKNRIDESEMVCLTFTNRAAKNMLDRIEKELGSHKIFVGNIHSFCNTFLRKNRMISHSVSLLDEEDVEILSRQIIATNELSKKLGGNFGTSDFLIYNSYLKQTALKFDSSLIKTPRYIYPQQKEEYIRQACAEYEKTKEDSNFIDFDDLLTLTYDFLAKLESNARQKIMYKWIQIDEAQDLNVLQWAIVNLITSKEQSHRVFFGDYEQSIFSFMGAKIETLNAISAESTVHELHYNYRSPQYLLDLYNTYARLLLDPKWSHNPVSMYPYEKPSNGLKFKEIPDVIHIGSRNEYGHSQSKTDFYSTAYDEIEWITRHILPREPQESTAILVRANQSADDFAAAFNERGIKYFKISGFDLFRRGIVKDLMAFLNILINPYDRNSWIRILSLYGKMDSLHEARSLINEMFHAGISPLDTLSTKYLHTPYLDDLRHKIEHERIVVFDTETTGLDTDQDDVIQIAAIEIINGEIGKTFEVYINTQFDLTESEKIHKISKSFLDVHAIPKDLAFNQFFDFVGDDMLVAHNSEYDYKIINSNLKRMGQDRYLKQDMIVDSIDVAKRLYPKLPTYKLEYLLERLGVEGVNSHNALDDVKATANLLKALSKQILETQPKRQAVLHKYEKTFSKFTSNFLPIYTAITGHFGRELSMHDIVDMIIGYMQTQLNYKMEENIYDEIEKLTRHMRFKCIVDESLKSLKQYVPEYSRYKESDLVIGNEKLVIATIHKAKGLEFENVIIPACTDDNFPSYYSKQSEKNDGGKAIIEDARLLYVAMTRARKRLLITSYNMKVVNGQKYGQAPSRFLAPIMHMLQPNVSGEDND